MRFIDLFAGLGGFHQALAALGHQCVFASEIDKGLRDLYQKNFGLVPLGDIRAVQSREVPDHDILCAGFPCQPFSKAGEQEGFDCPKFGDLFNDVLRIARYRKPTYIILENVPNLAMHDDGATWSKMKRRLERGGYTVEIRKLSPHRFGIPQIRERVFIVGSLRGLDNFKWPEEKDSKLSIRTVLDNPPPTDARPIPDHVVRVLEVWQDFIQRFPKEEELPTFPIWSMEFGATYPYEDTTPHAIGARALARYKGNHGMSLSELLAEDRFSGLPSYARSKLKRFPAWKVRFIRLSREFYQRHKDWIDEWKPSILPFPQSRQKLEWNCKGAARDIWQHMVQLRASGVRVKRATTAPAIVAMTATQVPIVAWERRYMTPRECARLQSLDGLQFLPSGITRAYEALGNAVNADVVKMIAERLLPTPANGRSAKEQPPERACSVATDMKRVGV